MKEEDKDLCKTCEYYWLDFPLPLERYVSHCEIVDEKNGLGYDLDEVVSYPCMKCPFDCYSKKK